MLPLYLVHDDLERGLLERIFPAAPLLFDYFRLMYRSDDPRGELYESLADLMRTRPLT